jgi:hypothetical protein
MGHHNNDSPAPQPAAALDDLAAASGSGLMPTISRAPAATLVGASRREATWRSPPLGAALCDALCFPHAVAQLARLRRAGSVERRSSTTRRSTVVRDAVARPDQPTPALEPLKVPVLQTLQVAQETAAATALPGDGQEKPLSRAKPEPRPVLEPVLEPDLEPELVAAPEPEPEPEPPKTPARRPSGPPPAGGPSPNRSPTVQGSKARGLQALRTPPRAGASSTAASANAR